MRIGEVTDITGKRSYIRIHFDDEVVRMDGEMLVGGFVAREDTMHWESVNNLIMNETEKQEIITKALKAAQKYGLNLIFE